MEVTNGTPLSFVLQLIDGRALQSVGEASEFFAALSQDQRDRSYWAVAIRMLAHAIREPAYLKAATMSLQTALLMDGLLQSKLQE